METGGDSCRLKDGPEKLIIEGIEVEFPFKPYECQLSFMRAAINAMNKGQNALLESPTGTGKTLCLLCSSVAWIRNYIKKNCLDKEDLLETKTLSSQTIPKIIYASRTHGQLAQVVQELRRTSFSHLVKTTVIGSRGQLCIHPDVAKLRGNNAAQNRFCSSLASNKVRPDGTTKNCVFRERLSQVMGRGAEAVASTSTTTLKLPDGSVVPATKRSTGMLLPGICDVEDLVKFGRENMICPYLLSKKLVSVETQNSSLFRRIGDPPVEIVFVPYNYLLDPKIRESLRMNMENSILIFDEAHNLDGSCAEIASVDFRKNDIDYCIKQAQNPEIRSGAGVSLEEETLTVKFLTAVLDAVSKNAREATLEAEKTLRKNGEPKYFGATLPGDWVFRVCEENEIDPIRIPEVSIILDKYADHMQDIVGEEHFDNCFETVSKVMRAMSITPRDEIKRFFNVYVEEQGVVFDPSRSDYTPISSKPLEKMNWKFGFWCFSPSVAMRSLLSENNIRAVLLASGTLSPFESIENELGMDFPIKLENSHVISKENVWVSVLSASATGIKLNSSHKTSKNPEYLLGIGQVLGLFLITSFSLFDYCFIVNIARFVPAGMLAFFPSYSLMSRCIEKWHQKAEGASKTIWEQIEDSKYIFVEPKYASEMGRCIEDYHRALEATKPDRYTPGKKNGAMILAVARGKVSEGIDFSNDNARAVAVFGLPFPSKVDPRVNLKWAFLDSEPKKKTEQSKEDEGAGALWYTQQAMRAVNQSIGRVIRNIHDYGAILLCDERYAFEDNRKMLSAWIRPSVKIPATFGEASRSLISFFNEKKKIEQSSAIEKPPEKKPRPTPMSNTEFIAQLKQRTDQTTYQEFTSLLTKMKTTTIECAKRRDDKTVTREERYKPLCDVVDEFSEYFNRIGQSEMWNAFISFIPPCVRQKYQDEEENRGE